MPSSLRVAVVTLGALCFGASATAQQQERTPPQQRVAVERPAAEWAAVERAVERVAAPARPTTPALRIVERTDAGLTIEVRADWAEPLTDAAAAEGPAQLALQSVNGHRTVSEIVALPTLAAPAVEVLAADYDEVPLPQRVDLSGFAGPTAEVVRVGVERRRPTGTFVARLLQADEERNTLRRYRRLVVAVRFAERDRPVAGRGLGGFLRGSDNPHLAVEQSVLAEGQWYKVPVTREGLYRIDRAWLDGLGLDPDGIDPARVQVYGNGGAPLPEKNSTPRIADLAENAVHVVGGGDGRFDSGDAVFFYGAPTHGWRWDPDEAAAGRPGWRHWINLFSVPNYYFVRIGGPPSARVGDPDFANLSGAEVHQSVVGRTFREEDLPEGMIERDGGGSGLDWFGQVLTPARSSAVVLDTIPTGLQGGAVTYRIRVATRTTTRATLEFRSGGAVLGALQPSATIGTTTLGRDAVGVFEGSATSGQPLRVDVSLSEGNAATRGWVDYVEAFFPKALRASDDWLRFHTPGGEAGAFEFVLSGFSGEPQVWDVTDPAAIRRLGVAGSGSAWRVQVAADDPLRPRELVAFTTGSGRVLAPAAGTPVANQNLHGLAFNPDYVIVVPKAFRAAADALAEHRRADGLNPLVVEMDAIYNEFSGGLVDMRAVRDFLRFVYDRAPGEEPTLQHVLLLGDGHYDFRGIKPGGDLNNWVPTYQTENSLSRVYSYTSDDYFGLLDPEEGEWSFPGDSTPDDERLDIGIGRLPVRSLGEAMAVVEKIRRYESPETQGAWRTRYTFVADDQYPNAWDRDLHVQNADVVAGVVNESFPEVNLQKIYTMTYPRVQTAIGARYPEAVADIHRAI
ncbi:MAG: C25 family cysteine peptidase, partial [Rhodothermales bacterium]|nr:C25 family cysteine peptidase [Rhodothermales bacterium]